MSKKLNISVLVSARDEYICQLKCVLIPLIIQGFNSIYDDANKLSGGKQIIYKFQQLLKEIRTWNQTILQEESKRVKRKCSYIMDIVTAIFVTNVKILASVRLKGSKDDIRVKIPTSDIFIHGIYIESAQNIFYDPFLFYHKNTEIQKNKYHVKEIISNAIDETIRRMLPFDDILQKYLADALNDTADLDSDSEESGKDSISDSDEESINNDDFSSESEQEEDVVKSFNIDKDGTTFNENLTEPGITELNNPPFNFPPPINTNLFSDNQAGNQNGNQISNQAGNQIGNQIGNEHDNGSEKSFSSGYSSGSDSSKSSGSSSSSDSSKSSASSKSSGNKHHRKEHHGKHHSKHHRKHYSFFD